MAEPTVLIPSLTPMNMQSFHCDTFELQMRFQARTINLDAFLNAVSEKGIHGKPDADGNTKIALVFRGNSETSSNCHAHLTVSVRKSGQARAELTYHSVGTKKAIVPPPSVEDCAQWFGSFLTGEIETHLHIDYTFDESFTPAISLRFPLTTSEKSLAGALVSGLALTLPEAPSRTLIIQSGEEKETYLFIRETTHQSLKDFNLLKELEQRSELVSSIVKKSNK